MLDNGLRCIIAPAQTAGVCCGIAVDAGTRDELAEESGMAHFTEHMTFKGTKRRSALQIINRLDGVGGELNAFTGKEETIYYASVEPAYLSRALDLLFDIVFCSRYPDSEMAREAEVVIDEIESYRDSPAELIYDDFEALLFPSHPLGRNILGEAEALRTHTSAKMHAFTDRLYRTDQAVLFVRGPVNPAQVMRAAKRAVAQIGEAATALAPTSRRERSSLYTARHEETSNATETIVKRDVHQAHVMTGSISLPVSHPDRLALVLLNNLLGGPGMNSRLNLALRERAGLVYTVESNYTGYTDTGVWSIYYGCDVADIKRCRRLVACELDRLCQSALTPTALAAAKRQMRGQLALSYDQAESIATGMGKTYLHHNLYRTMPQIVERIEALTAQTLLNVAQRTFAPEALRTLIYT